MDSSNRTPAVGNATLLKQHTAFSPRHAARLQWASWYTALLQLSLVAVASLSATSAAAQRPPLHYFHNSALPPGTVGYGQLQRTPELRGYTQTVRVIVPEGARVTFLSNGGMEEPQTGPVVAGMQVGSVYQLRITNIPFELGQEVYPTIEVVNRLHPPPGQQIRFPIPVELTQEELEFALQGRYVTRVIYLEDQAQALPHADEPGRQRFFEAAPSDDPLRVADRLGRPMAILRMGSRVPDLESGQPALGRYSPPVTIYPQEQAQAVETEPQAAVERHGQNVPRIALPRRRIPRITQPAGFNVP